MRDACAIWSGYIAPNGYGKAYNPRTKKMDTAHRVAWEREHGPVPKGYEPDHTCRTRACVNLAHLDLVTIAENRRGGRAKLSETAITHIRTSDTSCTVLAKKYGVHHSTITRLRRGESYKELI